jgi:hypothetical protein
LKIPPPLLSFIRFKNNLTAKINQENYGCVSFMKKKEDFSSLIELYLKIYI